MRRSWGRTAKVERGRGCRLICNGGMALKLLSDRQGERQRASFVCGPRVARALEPPSPNQRPASRQARPRPTSPASTFIDSASIGLPRSPAPAPPLHSLHVSDFDWMGDARLETGCIGATPGRPSEWPDAVPTTSAVTAASQSLRWIRSCFCMPNLHYGCTQ